VIHHKSKQRADRYTVSMVSLLLILCVTATLISLVGTFAALKVSTKLGALDSAPIEGQIKNQSRPIPNTGGIGIAMALWLPILIGMLSVSFLDSTSFTGILEPIQSVWTDLQERVTLGWGLLGCIILLHLLGLIDDRKPMGPWSKLIIMLVPAVLFTTFFDTRLLTMLDGYVGGAWLSILLTIVWIVAITNAMNFIDNMDGLSAGIAAIAGGLFLVAAILNAQWFIGVILALLVGGCIGFLMFNFPPAKIFMGDGGSLVIGFVLAITTVRTTYIPEDPISPTSSAWYALLMPIAVLAVPLYDFTSVTLIRIYQGKSPFVGDLQHFSHRLRDRGLGNRGTILIIYALTACSGIAGILLTRATPWEAALLGTQVILILSAIALFEYRSPIRSNTGSNSEIDDD
jgi:UDP-GlcNAc:undecaprenyl-phosphate/decaprenyl-phosphate GlcNAc-1-phosphate transferase